MLSLFYFLTFGGLVAMAVYLPMLLDGLFRLELIDAGFRAAGFVALATLAGRLGGSLARSLGGLQDSPVGLSGHCGDGRLHGAAVAGQAQHGLFTVGALGMAAAIGLGNGAVFKLVPQYFPRSVATVTGVVGAAGGLGGFFPPLALGIVKKMTGSYTLGFVLLGLFAAVCFAVCWALAPRRAREPALAKT